MRIDISKSGWESHRGTGTGYELFVAGAKDPCIAAEAVTDTLPAANKQYRAENNRLNCAAELESHLNRIETKLSITLLRRTLLVYSFLAILVSFFSVSYSLRTVARRGEQRMFSTRCALHYSYQQSASQERSINTTADRQGVADD